MTTLDSHPPNPARARQPDTGPDAGPAGGGPASDNLVSRGAEEVRTGAFFHEGSRPGFRDRFRALMVPATRADVAVTRLRLSTIDLDADEIRGLVRIRLVLSELRAVELDAEAHALMARRGARTRMARMQELLDRDVVRIRVAPLAGWSPDFTVFSGPDGPRGVLVGFHAFETPHPYAGPAFGAAFGPAQAHLARSRFEEVWARGHDVGPAVHSIFRRARGWIRAGAGATRRPKSVDTLQGLG